MSNSKNLFEYWKRDAIVAGVAGLLVAVSIGTVGFLLGEFSGAEARRLVEATIPTSRLFCSAIMTVSATILALMLTMIGLGKNADAELSDSHYHRILKLSFYDTVLFGVATVLMIVQCVPVHESDKIPAMWYTTLYYSLLVATAGLGGAAVAVISLLYLAVKDMIEVLGLKVEDHRLQASQRDSKKTEVTKSENATG